VSDISICGKKSVIALLNAFVFGEKC